MNPAKTFRQLKETEKRRLESRLLYLREQVSLAQRHVKDLRQRQARMVDHRQELDHRNELLLKALEEQQMQTQLQAQMNLLNRSRETIIRRGKIRALLEQRQADVHKIQEQKSKLSEQRQENREMQLMRANALMRIIREQRREGVEKRRSMLVSVNTWLVSSDIDDLG